MSVNTIIDNDLLSIQEARILAENAREAQKLLAAFPQEKLDEIVDHMAEEIGKYASICANRCGGCAASASLQEMRPRKRLM